MTFAEFFSKTYLFDATPPYQTKFYIPLIVIFSLLLVSSVSVKLVGKRMPKISNSFFNPFLIGSLLGFLYLFSRYESLPWLASRFFLLLILSGTFIWFIVQLMLTLRTLPKEIKEKTIEERYQKYLPKSKIKR